MVNQHLREEDLKNWDDLLHSLFGSAIPSYSEWTRLGDIVGILDAVGKHKAMNHTFFPSGGGLDLSGAKPSAESGMLELDFGGAGVIVNPNKLTFHSFNADLEWAYFRLDCNALSWADTDEMTDEIKASLGSDFAFEEVTELFKGEYIQRDIWNHGYYGYDESGDPKPLPKSARPLSRLIRNGSFVLFAKMSKYGQRASYDGAHETVTNKEFEEAIREVVEKSKKQ